MRLFQKNGIYHVEIERNKRISLKTRDYNKALEIAKDLYGGYKKICAYCGNDLGMHKHRFCNDLCRSRHRSELERYSFLRKFILDAFQNKCAICSWAEKLVIHHIDNNGSVVSSKEKNNAPENLIVICYSCHAKIHVHDVRFPSDSGFWIGKLYPEIKSMIIREMKTVAELKRLAAGSGRILRMDGKDTGRLNSQIQSDSGRKEKRASSTKTGNP